MIQRKELIEKMAGAIKEARKQLYDTVKNATNSEPTNSNLQARNMRQDLAEFFGEAALQALLSGLPEPVPGYQNKHDLYYRQLMRMKK